jgi:hypothetical protein
VRTGGWRGPLNGDGLLVCRSGVGGRCCGGSRFRFSRVGNDDALVALGTSDDKADSRVVGHQVVIARRAAKANIHNARLSFPRDDWMVVLSQPARQGNSKWAQAKACGYYRKTNRRRWGQHGRSEQSSDPLFFQILANQMMQWFERQTSVLTRERLLR